MHRDINSLIDSLFGDPPIAGVKKLTPDLKPALSYRDMMSRDAIIASERKKASLHKRKKKTA